MKAAISLPPTSMGQLGCKTPRPSDAKVVIELDGSAHFADLEAYRRDRRKDFLLQQHGYFVLRFLAEDIGKHLDDVLDTILAALTSRSKPQVKGNVSESELSTNCTSKAEAGKGLA